MAEGKRTTERSGSTAHGRQDVRGQQSSDAPHDDHGHSAAAWTLVGVVLVGALVSAFAMVLNQPWLFWVGVVVVIVGVILGKVLQAMGFGKKIYSETHATDPGRPQGVQ